MDSMADLMKKLGWIAWCLTVIGWFLQPIISLLVNKIFEYLVFDISKKLKELEMHTIPKLKQTIGVVEENLVLGPAEDKGSQSHLKILGIMQMDLKSALYKAEDILDLRDYRRIEKGIYLGEDGSRRWVEHKLAAARAWIARCKESSFGRWMHVTFTSEMKSAHRITRQGQGWRHWRPSFDQFCSHRAIQITGAAQSWHQQLGQLFRRVILCRSGRSSVLLPVSINQTPQPPCLQSGGSVFVPADPTHKPSEEMVDEEEIVFEETQVKEGHTEETVDVEERVVKQTQLKEGQAEEIQGGEGEMPKEIEEGCEGGQISEDEIKTESTEVGETLLEEEIEENEEEGKEGEPNASSILLNCARSVLTWFVKLCFYRDWSYGIVGINSDKKDGNVPITERIRLRKQMKSIEDILTSSKKSNLLNQNSSSAAKDDDKESSSNSTAKNSDKDSTNKADNIDSSNSTAKQKEIDKLYRSIEQKVFGRDKHRKHISDMLREGPGTNAASSSTNKPYCVIGIYGITGSGKTTLAQYVCDYEKEAGHFDPVMFTHVGKTFSLGNIFRDMLEQITHTWPPNDESLKSLKTKLEETLKGKRFLLVLDDLWVNDDNQKEHNILLDTLRAALHGSRVLVTSQKTDVAEALGAQEQISIPDLEEGVYLSLFMHHARPDTSADDGEYERIGRKIANRLGRSPIAAVTVGKQLQRNKSISFWETTANLDVLNKTMGALWWGYQQLGVDIRRCFAYCSTFPKGYGLQRDELVRIWIAQGFVNTRSDAKEELEDVGQRYFDLLLTFSFLQASRKIYWPVRFTSHDLLHELAERVSSGEVFRIGLNDPPKGIPQGVRHVFIETICRAEVAEKIVDMENLRTLIIEEPYEKLHENRERNHDLEKFLERLFMKLTKLRVLIIELGCWRNKLSIPTSIEKMKHLRYLGFCFKGSVRDISNLVLPSTFSKLYHMQTIDIPGYRSTSCPEDMANLINLRHIFGRPSFPNIGRLTALQTLREFTVEEGQGYGLKQLMQLNKLRGKLRIEGLQFVRSKEEALEAQLTQKERLRILELDFGYIKWFGPDVEAEVLEGLCPPIDLQELKIHRYRGSRYPSWMLSRHHTDTPKHLHRLELSIYCSQLASIPEGSELFTGLRELRIHSCDWDSLPGNMECMVSLQILEIEYCDKMEHLPTLPQALKTIIINYCHMLRSIGIMDFPRLEFKLEKEKRLEACKSLEYCQHTGPTRTPEKSPYPMIPCPCLVTLEIRDCANMVTLSNLPRSLKNLIIDECRELCSVSGQLGQLEKLHISNCHNLQSVDSLGDASSLEILSLSWCPSLSSLGSGGGPGSYLALRVLWIQYCPAMDMKQFKLDGLELKHISHAHLRNPTDERA